MACWKELGGEEDELRKGEDNPSRWLGVTVKDERVTKLMW